LTTIDKINTYQYSVCKKAAEELHLSNKATAGSK
jgi:hypothetical protein